MYRMILFATFVLLCVPASADEPPKKLTATERMEQTKKLEELTARGDKAFAADKFEDATKAFEQVLETARRLHPRSEEPDGNVDIAYALSFLAMCHERQGRIAQAVVCSEGVVAEFKLMIKGDHSVLATSMMFLAGRYLNQGRLVEADAQAKAALAMARRIGKDDGELIQSSLNQSALVLQALGRLSEAEPLAKEAVDIARRIQKGDNLTLAAALRDLAVRYQAEGKFDEAEPPARQAMEMARRLNKNDNQLLASSLLVLGGVNREMGRLEEAEPHLKDALKMAQGVAHGAPSPDQSVARAHLSLLYKAQGKLAEAEAEVKGFLQVEKQLGGGDHNDVATAMSNLAYVYQAQGKLAEAEQTHGDALAMSRRLTVAFARQKSEGETLNLVAGLPRRRDGLLDVVHARMTAGNGYNPAKAYSILWDSKGTVARVYEQRQQQARAAAAAPEVARQVAELAAARRGRAERLLAATTTDPDTLKQRAIDIKALDDTIERVSATLARQLPAVARAERLNVAGLADLQKVLPADVAIVDYHRYVKGSYDKDRPVGKKEAQSVRYSAFVVTHDTVAWVDLDTAANVEPAVVAWRAAITSGKDIPATVSKRVRDLVWAPVRTKLPATIKTVYVCPDQALCRVPFAALPGDKAGTILLEDFAVAMIPHVPFLLDKLLPPDSLKNPPVAALVVGGVKYDTDLPSPMSKSESPASRSGQPLVKPGQKLGWTFLDNTIGEANGVASAVEHKKISTIRLDGERATSAAVLDALPKAKVAHLATHGFFADASFRGLFQLDEKEYQQTRRGERIGRAANSPLVMTGLVFAGANNPTTPGRGIVTGEALIDLDLSGLDLAVLSACETGLGDVAGGEGTFGLQRAFHYAGAKKVIATLWKVPDAATAALMNLFYQNLWGKDLSPLEALRQAQLELYRNPAKIPDLAKGFRGKFEEVPGAGAVEIKPASSGKAHPLQWAAFTLSGPGR